MSVTYGMTNVVIEMETHSGVISWMVYADSIRFGQHAIMAQCISKEEAEAWCTANGVPQVKRTAVECFRSEAEKGASGKLQIGNAMFRRLREVDGRFFGYGGGYGSRYDTDLTDAIRSCKMGADGIGRTAFRGQKKTVKFGTKCTW